MARILDEETIAEALSVQNPLEVIFRGRYEDIAFNTAIQNLARIKPISEVKENPMPGKPFDNVGVMGFRRQSSLLRLTIACERAMVRNLELGKFIAMVERMNDPEKATIVLENFTEADENRVPRGQVLGRINPEFSCITVAQGLTGRVIHSHSDLARLDAYYISREQLTSFYLAAKAQIGDEGKLNELVAAYDGWKAFDIPLNPCHPEL